MSKIPYVFKSIPDEFMTDEFLKDFIMMKIVREIYSRIRLKPHLEKFDCNSTTYNVLLPENHFIFGRKAWAKKLNTDEETIKRKMNKLYRLKFVERYPEKTTSSSTSSLTQRSTSSDELFSTSSYSVCRLCVERFRQQKMDDDNHQSNDRNNQQFDQQFNPKINHKEEALASSPSGSNLCAEEEQQQTRRPGVVVSIEEGWRYLKEILRPPLYVMWCSSPGELVKELRKHKLSDEDIQSLKKYEFELVDMAIQFVNHPDVEIQKTVLATIRWYCNLSKKGNTPKLPERKRSGRDLVEAIFKNGQIFFENSPLRVSIYFDEFQITFIPLGSSQPSMRYNSDGFEQWLCAKIEHYKLPIDYKKHFQKAA